jgi:D-alanine-D-alanine ligase-like ATP-grasp enzyme
MRKVLVIFGGVSPEHEVSCRSAAAVLENIDRKKNQVHTVGITKEGKWLYTYASAEEIANGAWVKSKGFSATISCDRIFSGLLVFENDKIFQGKSYGGQVVCILRCRKWNQHQEQASGTDNRKTRRRIQTLDEQVYKA